MTEPSEAALRRAMTHAEARIIILEDQLIQSHHTISFLHDCLIKEKCKYSHPEETAQRLKQISEVVKMPSLCAHLFHNSNCPKCVEFYLRSNRLREARELIDG